MLLRFRRQRRHARTVVLFAVLSTFTIAWAATPDWQAVREKARLLANPGVILWVMPRPGTEDVIAAACLREDRGIRSEFLYLTNGEAVPDSRAEWSLAITAGRRKEEALESARLLGGTAYFANVPDRAGSWSLLPNADADTAIANVARVIRMVRPTMVIQVRDRMTGLGSTAEDSLVTDLVQRGIGLAAEQGVLLSAPLPAARRWQVSSFWIPSGRREGATSIGSSGSSRTIVEHRSDAVRATYQTLRALSRPQDADRYVGAGAASHEHARILGDGMVPVSPRLKDALRAMQKISGELARTRTRAQAQSLVDDGYRRVRAFLNGRMAALPEEDVRAIVFWKGLLDEIQYALASPGISVSVSDTLLIDRQVFMISVKVPQRVLRQGATQIMFQLPRDDRWIVNESLKRLFDLKKDSVFRVVTPPENQIAYPVPNFGLNRLILREPFRFAVIHEAASEQERFIHLVEVPLGYAAQNAGVILTPAVRTMDADPIVLDSYNFSRDSTTGFYWVRDSVCSGTTREFTLASKGSVSRDTLQLSWEQPSPETDYTVDIHAGRALVGRLLARSITLPSLASRTYGLITPRRQSAVASALRRMGARVLADERADAVVREAPHLDAVLVDRGASVPPAERAALLTWVRSGGRVVVLGSPGDSWRVGADSIWVAPAAPLPATDTLAVLPAASASDSTRLPMSLLAWGVTPAWSVVRWSAGFTGDIGVAAPDGRPLVASIPVDRGRITVMTLSMGTQLPMIHPGFFRVLSGSLL